MIRADSGKRSSQFRWVREDRFERAVCFSVLALNIHRIGMIERDRMRRERCERRKRTA